MSQHHDNVIRWLADQGAEDPKIEHIGRSKHPRVAFTWRGVPMACAISSTPGNEWTAERSIIKQLSHLLGLVGGEKRVGERRKRQHVPKAETQVSHAKKRARGTYGFSKFEPDGAVASLGDVWPQDTQQ